MANRYHFLIIIFLFTSQASAQGETDNFAIPGVGAISCGNWIENRKMDSEPINNILASWLQGFLSGMNTHRGLTTENQLCWLILTKLVKTTLLTGCTEFQCTYTKIFRNDNL